MGGSVATEKGWAPGWGLAEMMGYTYLIGLRLRPDSGCGGAKECGAA